MSIVVQLFEIVIRRREPQDIDYDITAAALSFAAIVAMGFFITSIQTAYSKPLMYSFAQSVIHGLIVFVLLKFSNKENRYIQTITALFGVSVILQMVSLILLQVPEIASLTLLLSIWNFVLAVLILKAALECSTLQSVLLTIAYQMIALVMLVSLFPDLSSEFMSLLEQGEPRT